jgi:hypothetical protein
MPAPVELDERRLAAEADVVDQLRVGRSAVAHPARSDRGSKDYSPESAKKFPAQQ